MVMLKMVFFGGLVLLGSVAVFLGVVFLLATGYDGPIAISYLRDGQTVVETVRKADDAGRYWRLYTIMGLAPLMLGAAAAWLGVRTLRR